MDSADLNAAMQRLNAGAAIPVVEPSLLEQMWQAISSIARKPPEGVLHASAGLVVAQGDPKLRPQDADGRVAVTVRYALMNALIERGLLDDYMNDESQRKKVFMAAALFPCDRNDLIDAVAQKLVRDSKPEAAQEIKEELQKAGSDLDAPKVAAKFMEWMRDHC